MTVGVLFLLILFLSPLSYLVPAYATAPALMYVGLLMLSNVAKIDFNDFVDAMAGLITAVFIVLTCNIVTGIMIGFATGYWPSGLRRVAQTEPRHGDYRCGAGGVLRRRLGDLNPSCSSRAAQAARFIFKPHPVSICVNLGSV